MCIQIGVVANRTCQSSFSSQVVLTLPGNWGLFNRSSVTAHQQGSTCLSLMLAATSKNWPGQVSSLLDPHIYAAYLLSWVPDTTTQGTGDMSCHALMANSNVKKPNTGDWLLCPAQCSTLLWWKKPSSLLNLISGGCLWSWKVTNIMMDLKGKMRTHVFSLLSLLDWCNKTQIHCLPLARDHRLDHMITDLLCGDIARVWNCSDMMILNFEHFE